VKGVLSLQSCNDSVFAVEYVMPSPSLATLTARFLANQATSPSDDFLAEVQPHEVVTSFRTDSAVMWSDAKAPFELFGVNVKISIPLDWSAFAASQSDSTIMLLSLGSVPQHMRELNTFQPMVATPNPSVTGHFEKLVNGLESCRKSASVAERLMAAGILKLLGRYDSAESLIALAEPECHGALTYVLANERAAIRWHCGDLAGALAAWQSMGDGPVATFNRGVCEWMMGRPAAAAALFDRAAGSIPDRSGWSHLAAFYASICEDV
jgi:hypothetical protein